MIILNAVLTRAKAAGLPLEDLKGAPQTIVDGLHLEIHQLPSDAIQMHEMIYPHAQNVVKRAPSGQRAYFAADLLDGLIKGVSDLRRLDGLERVDVKRILFETGALGLAQAAHAVADNEHRLLEGVFEYQLKDTLALAKESVCMIHPMFHEWLQVFVDQTTLTYPLPYEEEEHAVLARFGIRSIHR